MSGKAQVLVLMGSDSDLPAMEGCFQTLDRLGIGYDAHVASAHRTPETVRSLVSGARGRGVRVVIAAAGGAAHLAGVAASLTTLPVIGIPLASGALHGMDSLTSTANMPPGVPVACVSLGAWGATNAAVLAAEILGVAQPAIEKRLRAYRADAAARIGEKSRRMRAAGVAATIAGMKSK